MDNHWYAVRIGINRIDILSRGMLHKQDALQWADYIKSTKSKLHRHHKYTALWLPEYMENEER